MEKLIEIRDVDTGYGDICVLRNINLTICDKDFIGIIGPNGGGKTTLLKLILGLIKPFKGSLVYHFKGRSSGRNANIGYLPQFNETDKKFPVSVRDVVLSGLIPANKIFYRYSGNDKWKADALIDKLGMTEKRNASIGELSGGELQRVFLARAIISSPILLVLDEPGTYVDNRFENELYELLLELNNEMAILLVSHDLGIISAYVKTIACVNTHLTYHDSNVITAEQLNIYNCPVDIITHGKIPHRVLHEHKHK